MINDAQKAALLDTEQVLRQLELHDTAEAMRQAWQSGLLLEEEVAEEVIHWARRFVRLLDFFGHDITEEMQRLLADDYGSDDDE